MVDVLTSIAVIALLISLLLPSLGPVRESANQVVCRSGIRQIGIGIAMYAEENRDLIPASEWLKQSTLPSPQTIELRIVGNSPSTGGWLWDSLGNLYKGRYIDTPEVFYCPSHRGPHRFSSFADAWRSTIGGITGNYQYRGEGPNRQKFLQLIEPKRGALVSDGLRSKAEYSHGVGANVLRADLSVFWFQDRKGEVFSLLGGGDGLGSPVTAGQSLKDIWKAFDEAR